MASSPVSDPRTEGVGDARPEGDDAEWVRSFLRTQSGKTYRIDADDEAHEDAAREALTVAARILTDEVRRESDSSGANRSEVPDQSP